MAIQGEPNYEPILLVVVPRDALTRRGEQWLIYSVVEGKAKQVELIADMGEKMAISNEQLKAVVRGGDGLSRAQLFVTEPDNTQTSN